MRTLKLKGRPTNAFFTTVDKMFGGSSQLTTTAEHCFVVLTVHNDLITARSAAVGNREDTAGAGKHLIDDSEKRICRLDFTLRVVH